MRKMYLFLGLFLIFSSLSAQNPVKHDLGPCGTPAALSPWLKAYAAKPDAYFRGADTTLYVRMKAHLLANDNGVGRMTPQRLLDAFCRLNSDFESANVQFFFDGDWNEVNNTAWNSHADIPTGYQMMLSNDVPTALNSYMVSDPAGNCGYNLPYGSVAVANSCSGPNDHTWAHEVGHNLSLPHPFIGWEGKTYSYADSTPLLVTYDYTYFHDTIDPGPTALDTALVENLNGNNCGVAADLFCMTAPDYLSYRWNCNSQNLSTVKQRDPNGADFYSDGSLYMSYAADECQSRFSEDQIAALRANLLDEKAFALEALAPFEPVIGTASLVFPADLALTNPDGTHLQWKSVSNATKYLVQVSRIPNFAFSEYQLVTSDTAAFAVGLADNRTYYWRVRAFNGMFTCTDYSVSNTFKTNASLANATPEKGAWKLYPSLSSSGTPLMVDVDLEQNQQWTKEILSAAGMQLENRKIWLQKGENLLEMPTLAAGFYFVRFSNGFSVKTFPFVVR